MAKKIGILFADISGTTRLYRKIGTDEARHQLERCIKRMERAIASCKGDLVLPAVDEMAATFDSADEAVLAAIETQRRVLDLPPLSGIRLSIRVGVHFGVVEREGDRLSGSGADTARRLLNLAGSGQIMTCAATAEAVSRSLRDNLYSVEGASLDEAAGGGQVYRVSWQSEAIKPVASNVPATAENSLKIPLRLALRWDGRAYLVDSATTSMQIGRDRDCDLLLRGAKVSRHHARIELRSGEGFVLVDESSNGTYLYVDGMGESRLHNDVAALQGRGRIAFGHTTEKDDGEVVEFELS